ncbi:MAG: low molecular weight phosphotyrosine protein phosphatase, partial [Candidatus Scalindua sp.]|nr:low molecular weight phosphotyrosine protein phosphatase [Candidatus Scalindua sp.]
MIKVLFVCLGNICRSPSAEAVFTHLITEQNLQERVWCDSAGTYGGHAGHPADSRMQKHAILRGFNLTSISRQLTLSDFEEFDLVIGMDDSNISDMRRLDKDNRYEDKIVKMTNYCKRCNDSEVPDPYYGGA